MSTFVDTSALLALLDGDNPEHPRILAPWSRLVEAGERLWCSNYVLVETSALVQKRLGKEALRALCDDIVPVLRVHWIEETEHGAAARAVLAANRRSLSLVDCASFGVMRARGLKKVLTLDGHFAEQGFECLPERGLSAS